MSRRAKVAEKGCYCLPWQLLGTSSLVAFVEWEKCDPVVLYTSSFAVVLWASYDPHLRRGDGDALWGSWISMLQSLYLAFIMCSFLVPYREVTCIPCSTENAFNLFLF